MCNTISGDIALIGMDNEDATSMQKKSFSVGGGIGKLDISSISGDIDVKTLKE